MRKPSLTELEDLILQLDSTLADIETAKRKGYHLRDTRKLRDFADRIHASRKRRQA